MLTNFYLQKKSSEACIKARSNPASLLFKGLVAEHTTIKLSIVVGDHDGFWIDLLEVCLYAPLILKPFPTDAKVCPNKKHSNLRHKSTHENKLSLTGPLGTGETLADNPRACKREHAWSLVTK